MEQIHALGRRKAAVARVYLVAGSGNIVINDRPLEDYFKEDGLRYMRSRPPVSSPAIPVRSSGRSPDSLVPADASSSVNVSIHTLFYFLHSWVANPRTSFGMGIPGSYWKVAHTAENPRD